MKRKILVASTMVMLAFSGCSETSESVAVEACKALKGADFNGFTSLIQKEERDKKGLAITMLEGMIKDEKFQARFVGVSCSSPTKAEELREGKIKYSYEVDGKSVMRLKIVKNGEKWYLTNR